jgi:hypothetical protein
LKFFVGPLVRKMKIKVCRRCADEARAIGLVAKPLNELAARSGTDPKVAA